MKPIRYLPFLLLLAAASTASALTEEKVEQKRDVTPGGTLIVDVEFGTIDVTGGDTKQVVVNAERRIFGSSEAKEKEFLESAPITVTQEGNTVTVRARRPKGAGGWLSNWGGSWKTEARYTIRVPAKFNATLDTSGGKILVSDLTGEVKANTSGGALKFTKIRGPLKGDTSGGSIAVTDCDGEIQIETSGGKIEVGGGSGSLAASTSGGSISVMNFGGSAKVETSGGSLRFENVRGSLNGETSGGSIAASLSAPVAGDVRLETSAGRIEVSVPADAALNLDASTSMGSVTSDLPVSVQGKQDRDRLKGTINGGGKLLVLRTSAGRISVKQGGLTPAKP